MARICRKADSDLSIRKGPNIFIPKVVFDISIARYEVGNIIGREFVKDRAERFANNLAKDIQSTAVGHSHRYLFNSNTWRHLKNPIENRH